MMTTTTTTTTTTTMAKPTRVQPAFPEADDDLEGLTEEEDRLFTAISFGKAHRVTSLLPHLRSAEVRNDFGNTPLLHTARHARGDQVQFLIKLLLQSGSDVNAQDEAGMTSLMHLVRAGSCVDAVRTLMRCRHCDPDLTDEDGNTALMHAAKVGDAEALGILLLLVPAATAAAAAAAARKPASVDARNKEGLTALDLAVREKDAECCRLLVEEGRADTGTVRDAETFTALMPAALSRREDSSATSSC